jgi:hypothetical protein
MLAKLLWRSRNVFEGGKWEERAVREALGSRTGLCGSIGDGIFGKGQLGGGAAGGPTDSPGMLLRRAMLGGRPPWSAGYTLSRWSSRRG